MFKPVDMQKLRIVALSSIVEDLITFLHEKGVMHIEQVEHEELETNKPLPNYDVLSSSLVKARAILSMLKKRHISPRFLSLNEALKVVKKLEGLHDKLAKIKERKERLEKEREDLIKEREKLQLFSRYSFSPPKSLLIYYFVGKGKSEKEMKIFREKMAKTFPQAIFFVKKYRKGFFGMVALPKDYSPHRIFSEMNIDYFTLSTSPKRRLEEIKERIREIDEELGKIDEELTKLSLEHYENLENAKETLKLHLERAEIASRFGFSKRVVVIEGWVRKDTFPKLKKELHKKFGEKVIVTPIYGEDPPTILENPEIVKPFEFIVRFYSLPKGNELDPSIIYTFTIPLLYGAIIGDVLYSLFSILFARWLMKKWKEGPVYWFAKVWEFSALGGIIWGIVFDEWFGMSHQALLGLKEPIYHGFHRMALLPWLVVASIFLGIFHLSIGFLLGAVKEWHHNKKHALGKVAWVFALLSGTTAVMTFLFPVLPSSFGGVSLLVFFLAVGVIGFTEGIAGIFELPGVLGNVLSYARIAAVGVAGVVLAELINEFLSPSWEAGLLNFILLPLFLSLHFANALLAMFESLVQGGRLNLVEFGSKFFEGGGKPFTPFAYAKRR